MTSITLYSWFKFPGESNQVYKNIEDKFPSIQ